MMKSNRNILLSMQILCIATLTSTFRYETYTDDECALDNKRAEVMVSFGMEDEDLRLAGYSINTRDAKPGNGAVRYRKKNSSNETYFAATRSCPAPETSQKAFEEACIRLHEGTEDLV
eukprot:g1692.t1